MEKMPVEFIDIMVKGAAGCTSVLTLRANERVANLRVLVGMRFEHNIDRIVLVFAGRMLPDVGTIDQHGIGAGMTVHVVLRNLPQEARIIGELERADNMKTASKRARLRKFKNHEAIKLLFEEPSIMREALQKNSNFKSMIDENTHLHHYLNNDGNLRNILSTVISEAKLQEQSRRFDLQMLRMEYLPGGKQLLHRLSNFMRQSYENAVAMSYQEIPKTAFAIYHRIGDENSQRGCENNLPLPNPWQPNLDANFNTAAMVSELWERCDTMMDMMQSDDLNKARKTVALLSETAETLCRMLSERPRNANITVAQQQGTSTRVGKAFVPGGNTAVKAMAEKSSEPIVKSAADMAAATATTATSGAAVPDAATPTRPLSITNFLSGNLIALEQRFDVELAQLNERGYTNRRRNVGALLMSFGNVENAIMLLKLWRR